MPEPNSVSSLHEEDCTKIIVAYLRTRDRRTASTISNYGYDLYLPNVMREWLQQKGVQYHDVGKYLPEMSQRFYPAAWELCRRGIIRPGIAEYGAQSTEDGSAGNGYSITPFGTQWLSESPDIFVPTESGRFAGMLAPFSSLFGPGFHERASEAIRCYGAHAYLACSAMCGAAAESILLDLAVKKEGDEQTILTKYRAANGRRVIENLIIGQQRGAIQQDFEVCFSLLKYWRDEAAHGRKSGISENEAFTSIALLLRCAQFAKENYPVLTAHPV